MKVLVGVATRFVGRFKRRVLSARVESAEDGERSSGQGAVGHSTYDFVSRRSTQARQRIVREDTPSVAWLSGKSKAFKVISPVIAISLHDM